MYFTYTVQPCGEVQPGDEFCTYTQGGWGSRPHGGNPGTILADNFASVYSAGILVGDLTGPYSMSFSSASAVEEYLPARKTPGPLTSSHENPTTPPGTESGVFGGQVLALQLNVDFSDAGVTQRSGGPLGALYYCNLGDSLHGQTIYEILAAANTALGGGELPDGYTYSSLNQLVTNLNEAYRDCGPASDWTILHLSPESCSP